ncbi:MAG: type II toxin-antitoxin system HicB family antitoxin [Chloroflexi bacterium]|nr:type II toxin-antitoxin system HicB family antitoxin [Chloroflexota bacterium]
MKFLITLENDDDGFIVASCPALPGCHSQGRNRKEAIGNITESIQAYIESMVKHGERVPGYSEFQEIEVAI